MNQAMNVSYVASALEPATWPKLLDPRGNPLPEIALAGRSNVGKSTLINLLSGRKRLAKVSSTPGKTQRLQFFSADERVLLVDLPGFGYAKAPLALQLEWSSAIDLYLKTRPLACILLLLDIRRMPGSDDLNLMNWCLSRKVPVLPVFTKTDMLSPPECAKQKKEATALLGSLLEPISVPAPRRILWKILDDFIR